MGCDGARNGMGGKEGAGAYLGDFADVLVGLHDALDPRDGEFCFDLDDAAVGCAESCGCCGCCCCGGAGLGGG